MHTYNIFTIEFFGNVWASHLGSFLLILSLFDQLWTSSNQLIRKNSKNIKKVECMEYICEQNNTHHKV